MSNTIINTSFESICEMARSKKQELKEARTQDDLFNVLQFLPENGFKVKVTQDISKSIVTCTVCVYWAKNHNFYVQAVASAPIVRWTNKRITRATDKAVKEAMLVCLCVPRDA